MTIESIKLEKELKEIWLNEPDNKITKALELATAIFVSSSLDVNFEAKDASIFYMEKYNYLVRKIVSNVNEVSLIDIDITLNLIKQFFIYRFELAQGKKKSRVLFSQILFGANTILPDEYKVFANDISNLGNLLNTVDLVVKYFDNE